MKTNKKLLLLTSMVILFPMLWGLMIWSQLPNQIPIHFNFAGQANNFQSKPLVVFGLPIFDLMVHLFMIFMIWENLIKKEVLKQNMEQKWIIQRVFKLFKKQELMFMEILS